MWVCTVQVCTCAGLLLAIVLVWVSWLGKLPLESQWAALFTRQIYELGSPARRLICELRNQRSRVHFRPGKRISYPPTPENRTIIPPKELPTSFIVYKQQLWTWRMPGRLSCPRFQNGDPLPLTEPNHQSPAPSRSSVHPFRDGRWRRQRRLLHNLFTLGRLPREQVHVVAGAKVAAKAQKVWNSEATNQQDCKRGRKQICQIRNFYKKLEFLSITLQTS